MSLGSGVSLFDLVSIFFWCCCVCLCVWCVCVCLCVVRCDLGKEKPQVRYVENVWLHFLKKIGAFLEEGARLEGFSRREDPF